MLPAERPTPEAQRRLLHAVNEWLARQTPGTNRIYARCYRRVAPLLQGREMSRETAREVLNALYQSGLSPATVQLTINAMSSMWGELMADGIATYNPWLGLKGARPRITLPHRLLTEDEVRRIIQAAPDLHRKNFIRFLYATGLRVSEIIAVRWQDLRQDSQGTWYLTVVGKGQKLRTIIVPPVVVGYLRLEYPHPDPKQRLWPVIDRTPRWWIQQAARAAGISKPVSPHWFRHAYATHAIRHGAPLHIVQQSLGHSRLDTTGVYLDVEPGESAGKYLPPIP